MDSPFFSYESTKGYKGLMFGYEHVSLRAYQYLTQFTQKNINLLQLFVNKAFHYSCLADSLVKIDYLKIEEFVENLFGITLYKQNNNKY